MKSPIEFKTETIKIDAVETKCGIYISLHHDENNSHYKFNMSGGIGNLFFDGVHPKITFNESWFVIDKIPSVVEQEIQPPDTNKRFVLLEPSLANDKIPLEIKKEDAVEMGSDEYYWKPELVHLKSLYREVSDEQPNIKIPVNIEIVLSIKLDEIKEINGFSYPTIRDNSWVSTGYSSITENDVEHQLLDKILFPSIALCSRPCKLTSRQSYGIVRKHVLLNIDPRYAKVTSDYDFCFTVTKTIALSEKQAYTYDANTFTKSKKPKMVSAFRTERAEKVFEMTHSEAKYQGYTPIIGFEGNDYEDLKNNIDTYLKELMEKINEPLVDCPHCKGAGVLKISEVK